MTEILPPPTARRRSKLIAILLFCGGILVMGVRSKWNSPPPPPQIGTESIGDPAVAAAIADARAAVIQSPRSGQAWGRLGMVLYAHDFLPESIACFAPAENLDPREPSWPYYHGLALSFRDPEEAARSFVRAVELTGNASEMPRFRLIDVLLTLERNDEAERHLLELVREQPDNSRVALGLARVAMRRGQARKALAHLNRAESDPRLRKSALTLQAQAHQMLGEKNAVARLQQTIAQAPDDELWSDPFLQRVMAHRTGKNASITIAGELFLQNRIREGVALAEQTAHDYPNDPKVWFMLGVARYQIRDLTAAERALRKSLALEAKSAQAQFLLGIVLGQQGNLRDAEECFRATTVLKVDHAEGYYNLGLCLLKKDDRRGAIEAFRKATQFDPGLAKAFVSLGELQAREGQTGEALVNVRQALRLRPEDRAARKLLAELQSSGVTDGIP